MGGGPDGSLHVEVPRPWRIRVHQTGVRRSEVVVIGGNGAPDFRRGQRAFQIVLVVKVCQDPPAYRPVATDKGSASSVWLIFRGPQWLSRFACGLGRGDLP